MSEQNSLPSAGGEHQLAPWPVLDSKVVGDFKIFTLKSTCKRSPRTGVEATYYALETEDWVNVVALTAEEQFVLVRQFRHATNTIELELPGGMMNKGETDPVAAACRELREETGYEGVGAQVIGSCFANPAILTNRSHTILVQNCVQKYPFEWDAGEDMNICLVPAAEISHWVARGEIRHSVMVAALYYYHLWKNKVT